MAEPLDLLTEQILGCAIEVHRNTGPGLLETVYDVCLAHEFTNAGLEFRRQIPLSFPYKDQDLGCGFRIDYVVEGRVLIEVKSVERTLPVHTAQVLTYLKLSGLPTGLLINFNVPMLRQGIRRLIWSRSKLNKEAPVAATPWQVDDGPASTSSPRGGPLSD